MKDVAEANEHCCVVLWNKTGPGRATLAVSRTSPPKAKGNIQKRSFGADFIPGEPLYYLVDGGTCCLWTLRPTMAQRTERTALERALKFYMRMHSGSFNKIVRKERTIGDDHVVQLIAPERNVRSMLPVFSAKMTRKDQKLEELVASASKIRKLVQVVSFKDMDQHRRLAIVEHLLGIFSNRLTLRQAEDTKKVKYEIDVKLDPEEIREIVARQENMTNSRVGFVAKGTQTPIWADETYFRFEKALSLPVDDDVFSAEDILSESTSVL